MADLSAFIRTLPARAVIRASGNPTFWKSFKAIAGSQVRHREIARHETASDLARFAERLAHDNDVRPVFVTGTPKKQRGEIYPKVWFDLEVLADFDDVSHVAFREHHPGHTTIKIIGGKILHIECRR